MTENKNTLGLDKFQITVIKSSFNSTKPIIKLREKAQKKLQDLKDKFEATAKVIQNEVEAYDNQIQLLDQSTIAITKKALGVELTSEQVMKFMEKPEDFQAYKNSLGLNADLFNDFNEKSSDSTGQEESPTEDSMAA